MRVGAQAQIGIDTIVGRGPVHAGIGVPLGIATLAAAHEDCKHPPIGEDCTES